MSQNQNTYYNTYSLFLIFNALLLALAVGYFYLTFHIGDVDTSISPNGEYTLMFQSVGYPEGPCGYAHSRFVLKEGNKTIIKYKFDIDNFGGAAYNSATGSHLQRHILACDEIAEFLDMRGLDKEHKDLVYQIINRLSVIARQGRAFGIHLILATQRPDADILPGQIKNNLDCRICGRADRILSQIILDSSDAASAIPKDSRGRFLMNDGTEFQSYYMDDIPMAAELDSYRNAHKFD